MTSDRGITLEPLSEANLSGLAELIRQPALNARLPFSPDFAGEEAARMLEVARDEHNDYGCWAIQWEDDASVCGGITIKSVWHPRCVQIGFWVDEAQQGQGIASRALAMLSMMLFATGAKSLQAQVEPDNAASIRVLEKAGFANEGLMPRSHQIGEKLVDTNLYAKLAQE